jgi:hypothetical protein
MKFLMSDVYDYLMENKFSIGTNFCNEFPKSWIDDDKGVIYLAKNSSEPIYKLNIEKV